MNLCENQIKEVENSEKYDFLPSHWGSIEGQVLIPMCLDTNPKSVC